MARKAKERVVNNAQLLTHTNLIAQQAAIQQKLGGKLIWGSDESLVVDFLPLGYPALDQALNGGLAFGKQHLLYGETSSGKSAFCLLAMKAAQREDLSVVYFDIERAYDPQWATNLGVDPTKLLIRRPLTTEEAFYEAKIFAEEGFGLIVIDSLAALSTLAQMNAPLGKEFMAEGAKAINDGLKLLLAATNKSIIITVNQPREKVGLVFGSPETLPGGKGQKFYAGRRIRMKGANSFITVDGGKDSPRIGFNLQLTVERDRHGEPWKSASLPILFTGEVDEVGSLVSTALGLKIIEQKGPWYYIEGESYMGIENVKDALRKDSNLFDLIKDTIDGIPYAPIQEEELDE